ncbi:hypothetical protein OsI_14925 [Oryza sativa Indica Group]|uniref:KIB1-4 beta-propeller domain-containing protein n=1 Tax=Oryza sativa subsp. indica TaxID=39946 RepID=B8AVE1_ORYSI|nr:hypothetical protein OsI_14925 [Oryza sativa Indica Group]
MEEEAEAGGDRCCWSWLPEDVLLTVMGFMEVPDVVRSGAACSAWRAAAAAFRSHRLPTPRQPPCLLYACDAYGPDAAALYSPSTAATFRVPFRIPRAVAGAAHGWLFATDDEANPYLVNPVTGARATLPPITTLDRVRSRETLVVGGGGGVVYGVDVSPNRRGEYTAHHRGASARLDVAPSPRVRSHFHRRWYLAVTPRGELLRVTRRWHQTAIVAPPDASNGRWHVEHAVATTGVEVEEIRTPPPLATAASTATAISVAGLGGCGDVALFLGKSSAACIPTEGFPMLRPNCAYLTDDAGGDVVRSPAARRDFGVWDFGSGRLQRLGDVWPLHHPWLYSPSPIWITPSLY